MPVKPCQTFAAFLKTTSRAGRSLPHLSMKKVDLLYRYIVRCQVFEPMFQPVQDSDRRSEEEDEDERAPRHRHRKEPEEDEVGVVWSIVAYCDLAIAKLIVGKVFLDILTVPEPCKNKIYLNRPIATFPRASCTLSILPNMVKQTMNARVPFASICWNLFPILEG